MSETSKLGGAGGAKGESFSPAGVDHSANSKLASYVDDYGPGNPRQLQSSRFDIKDTNQRLKFYPAINQRMNLNEFNINSSGIPKINQISRQMVNRSMNRYKPQTTYKYGN